jgi:hypothetical protein
VRVSDAGFECALVDRILAARLSEDGYAAYVSRRPEGLFDAVFTVTKGSTSRQPGAAAEMNVAAVFEPRSLTLHPGDTTVVFPKMSGQIEVDGGAGILRNLRAEAQDWSLTADGAWESSLDGVVSLRTQLVGNAASLTPDLRAMLPADLRETLESLALKVGGPLRMEDATLSLSRGTDPALDSTKFSGTFAFADAALEAGVSITDLNGSLEATYQKQPGDPAPQYTIDASGAQFRIGGIWLTDGHAQIRNGPRRGDVQVPQASGECYAGRFTARADVIKTTDEPEAPRRFTSVVQFAGVRLNPLLSDLTEAMKQGASHDPSDIPPADEASREDFSRGLMDAEFSMTGIVGHPATGAAAARCMCRAGACSTCHFSRGWSR